MRLSRLLSLVGGTTAAAATALLLALAPALGLPVRPATLPALGLISAGVGAVAALALLVFSTSLVETPLARLVRQIQQLADPHARAEACANPAWLGRIYDALVAAFARFQSLLEQANQRRRELELQVRAAENDRQNMQAIVHSIADGVIVTDAFNELILANRAAAEALHFNPEESRRQPIERCVFDPTLLKLIRDMRESGSPDARRHLEHRVINGGRTCTYDLTLACIANAQSEIAGVVTILRDITREKQIAELQSDFVSGVSHELRTPLSSIKAYIEMLVDGEVSDEKSRSEFYNIIQSETNRLNRLIDSILNISRIESGIVRVQREDLDLSRLVRDAVEFMQPQARAKQITLAESTPAVSLPIFADKDMLHQALLNLVGNAIKYTPSGGRVSVETTLEDALRLVTIDVIDNGVGIPREAMPHLFEKFFRVADHKKMAKGTGLGLNLVKHIVESVHNGRVSVESQVGKGSRFSVRLPLSHSAGATENRKLERSRT